MSTEGCQHDENDNIIDSITQDIIPPNRIIVIPSKGTVNCFDIETLYKLVRDSTATGRQPINPITQTPFPPDILNKIRNYGDTLKRRIIIRTPDGRRYEFTVDVDLTIGDIILEIFRHRFPNFQNFDTLFDYDFLINAKSIYTMDLLTPLRESNIPGSQTLHAEAGALGIQEIPIDVVYVFQGPRIRDLRKIAYPKWYQFAKAKGLDWLIDTIPEDVRQDINYRQIADLLYNYSGPAIDLLTILLKTIANNHTKITSRQARTLIGMLPFNLDPRMFNLISHVLYSRVIDKYNLTRGLIEREYTYNEGLELTPEIEVEIMQNVPGVDWYSLYEIQPEF